MARATARYRRHDRGLRSPERVVRDGHEEAGFVPIGEEAGFVPIGGSTHGAPESLSFTEIRRLPRSSSRVARRPSHNSSFTCASAGSA